VADRFGDMKNEALVQDHIGKLFQPLRAKLHRLSQIKAALENLDVDQAALVREVAVYREGEQKWVVEGKAGDLQEAIRQVIQPTRQH
jgi:hypothetical protein